MYLPPEQHDTIELYLRFKVVFLYSAILFAFRKIYGKLNNLSSFLKVRSV